MANEPSYKLELHNMEIRLSEMEDKIDVIDTKLTQVVDAILGNPLTKAGGLMHDIDVMKMQIQVLEQKQVNVDDFKKKIAWTIGIIVTIGAIIQFVASVYSTVKR